MMKQPNSFEALFDVIGSLARRRHQCAERSFSTLGLNHTEARLLTLLKKAGGSSSQDALSNLLAVDRSNAGRALKYLEEEGLIVRRSDYSDKRTNLVQITSKGIKTVAEITKLRKQMAQTFFGDLSPNEADIVISLLRRAEGPKGSTS